MMRACARGHRRRAGVERGAHLVPGCARCVASGRSQSQEDATARDRRTISVARTMRPDANALS